MRLAPSEPVPTESKDLFVFLVITRARALVRARKLEDAMALVDSYQEVRKSLVGREFYANLTTLRGDYKAARSQWAQILAEDPGHRKANEMVEAIDLWSVRPPWLSGAVAAGAIATALAIAGIGYYLTLPKEATKDLRTPTISVVPSNAGNPAVVSNLKSAADSDSPVITFSLTTAKPETITKD